MEQQNQTETFKIVQPRLFFADETEAMDIDVRETHAEFDDFSDSESDLLKLFSMGRDALGLGF
ncbi:9738_t:CDS:2 [Paraglomus brasilianum]|uniref:9738_t:CDS:1 n=1 Tax=Paraglomus brasilianum TaxID=144538 RepID=A0A9N9FD04_9GLOM|nr:9738_t:CDS:2 [Paraglomus brasilianum]